VGAAGRGQRGAVLSEQGGRGLGPGSVPGQHRLPRARVSPGCLTAGLHQGPVRLQRTPFTG